MGLISYIRVLPGARCLLVIALLGCFSQANSAEPKHPEEKDSKVAGKDLDWTALRFDETRPIESVKLQWYQAAFFRPAIEKRFSVESRDPLICKRLARGLSSASRDACEPENPPVVGIDPWGELHVVARGKTYVFYLYIHGFALDDKRSTTESRFVSWTAAKVVDELFVLATKKPLPANDFEGLSGEAWLKNEKAIYAKDEEKSGPKTKR